MKRPALALAAALALAGCAAPPGTGPAPSAWAHRARVADSLAARGEHAAATTSLVVAGRAPRAWRRDADVRARSLARERGLPAADRAALAAATARLEEGGALARAGSLAEARDRLAEAADARAARLGPGDLRAAEAALARAAVEFQLGRPATAESLAQRAQRALVDSVGPEHPALADAEELLGRIVKNYSGRPGVPRARAHYDAALRMRVALFGAGSAPVAESWTDLGNLYRVDRQPDVALALLGRALEIRRTRAQAPDEGVAGTLASMAFVAAAEGRWHEAEHLAHESLLADPGTDAGMSAMSLGLRGQMLLRLARPREAEPLLRYAAAIRESLWNRSTRDASASLVAGLALHRDLALALALQGRGEEAFDELARGSSRMLSGRWFDLDASRPDPWRGLLPAVQRALRPDEALVAWVVIAPTLLPHEGVKAACVVRPTGPVRWVLLPDPLAASPRERSRRYQFWDEMRVAASWPLPPTDDGAVDELARRMDEEWFAPLEPALAGVSRLVVCGPDLFTGGPLGALRDARGRWLADRFAISYSPSALLFVHERSQARSGTAAGPRAALLVGDPAYIGEGGRWPRLAGAAEEIRSLRERLPGARVLAGAEARAATLRAWAVNGELARYDILHFATHTTIDWQQAMESAIVLSPDRPGDATDSRLTGREIANTWRLDAGMVSLATCRSVQGPFSASDGMLGLTQAFLAAGARSLLVSVWPVDDRATAALMKEFYSRLEAAPRRDRSDVLRDAQAALRDFRASDGSRPFAHPVYWSGFMLVGDTR